MHWLLTAPVRRYLGHYGHSGHVWQGRFKAFPIQQDEHLLTVIRYVERNPLRAGLVERAQDWKWSSLGPNAEGPARDPGPVPRGADWLEFVNSPMTEAESRPSGFRCAGIAPTAATRGLRKPPAFRASSTASDREDDRAVRSSCPPGELKTTQIAYSSTNNKNVPNVIEKSGVQTCKALRTIYGLTNESLSL